MIFPLSINNLKQDYLFQVPNNIAARFDFFLFISLCWLLKGASPLRHPCCPISSINCQRKQSVEGIFQPFHVPFLKIFVFRTIDEEEFVQAIFDHLVDALFEAFSLQDLFSERVDLRPLLVHDVIVLDKVFPDIEVVGLDPFLGILDSL